MKTKNVNPFLQKGRKNKKKRGQRGHPANKPKQKTQEKKVSFLNKTRRKDGSQFSHNSNSHKTINKDFQTQPIITGTFCKEKESGEHQDRDLENAFVDKIPNEIISGKYTSNELEFLVEWVRKKENGTKPPNSYVHSSILKKHCPDLLIDFYEDHINSFEDRQRNPEEINSDLSLASV